MSRQPPESSVEAATWVDLLRWRARQQPDRRAYTYLIDGEAEGASLTYAELDRQARAIGAWLQQQGASGGRVLLLYPPGLDFVAAFFGCLYGGAVAVPAYPPQPARLAKTLPRIRSIASDAQVSVVLTTSAIVPEVEKLCAEALEFDAVRWLATDTIDGCLAGEWRDPSVKGDTLAFLQYTSGSTASPKGVMVSHQNLMHNSALIQNCGDTTPDSRGVFWLPPYHDMGLIGGILQTVFVGATTTLLSPVAFLQRPLRWLQAISDSRATHSGGPNFAYDLCVRKITPEQRATLDLSSWDVAFNGAEPIRQETLERFAAAFEPCGFRREAFYPCYGLAEATLIVSGGFKSARPIVRNFGVSALEHKRVVETSPVDEAARTFVGCGQNLQDQKIIIVDPETLARCLPDHVGEIWVAGPSIAQGYWNRPVETAESFKAYLVSTGEGPFLRTGDLGFMKDGELFITGRLKDLIIIRGINHYPQDIELTVEHSHPALGPNAGAAFSVEISGQERLVIVQEVKRQYRNMNVDEVVEGIRQGVAEDHGVEVYAVVLIKPGSIPKTSSGKIQRDACRDRFLNKALDIVIWSETKVEHLMIGRENDLRAQTDRLKLPPSMVPKPGRDQALLEHPAKLLESASPGCRNAPTREQDEFNSRETMRKDRTIGERVLSAPPALHQGLLEAYLRQRVARVLNMNEEHIPRDSYLLALGLDSIGVMDLIGELEEDFQIRLHPREFSEDRSIEGLAAYLAAELGRVPQIQVSDLTEAGRPLATIFTPEEPVPQHRLEARRERRRTERNPGIIFLLSSPRSGSTLLRVMLAGHPALFCPPEMHLLPFESMREWKKELSPTYLDEGLQRALMELKGIRANESKALLDSLVEQDMSIQEVYSMLQQLAGTRLLVDKSPSYATSMETLERAEGLFEDPKYIYLVRHPYAAIESFVRNRFDRLLGAGEVDRATFGEQVWATTNGNILDFLQHVDQRCHHAIRYEELVSEPTKVMLSLCKFLGIPFDEAVLKPYEGKRMTDGVHTKSLAVGDPSFLEHKEIDRTLGEVWKGIRLPRQLGGFARRVAAELGYELLQERSAPAVDRLHEGPQPPPILAVAREGNPLVAFTSSVIVPIQPVGSKPPFFCVAPAGGVVYPYYGLGHQLGEDQPFYALRDPSLAGECEPYSQIEDYAAHYLKAMRDVQPEGPYLLGGWSFGGLVAFEMALQLRREGQQVAFLVLIDTEARVARKRRSFKGSFSSCMIEFLDTLSAARQLVPVFLDGAYLAAMHLKRRKEHPAQPLSVQEHVRLIWLEALRRSFLRQANMADVLSRDPGLLRIWLPTTSLRRILRNMTSNMQTASRYAPQQAYPGRITLFRASDDQLFLRRRSKDSTLGWSEHAAGGVEVREIPGNHIVLFRRPFLGALATELRACIERAQADIRNGCHAGI